MKVRTRQGQIGKWRRRHILTFQFSPLLPTFPRGQLLSPGPKTRDSLNTNSIIGHILHFVALLKPQLLNYDDTLVKGHSGV